MLIIIVNYRFFCLQNIENELSGPSDYESMNEFQAISAITQHFVHLHGVLQNLEGRMIETVRIGSKQRDKKLVEIRDHTKGLTEKFQDAMLVCKLLLFILYNLIHAYFYLLCTTHHVNDLRPAKIQLKDYIIYYIL